MSGAQNTMRPRRLLLIAASAGVIVVAAIVGISLTISRGSSTAVPAPVTTLPDATPTIALFRGIPQHGLVLGSPTARTTLVEYLDLQCPWCGRFARDTFPTIVTRFVRTGRVRVEMRPLEFVGSDSVRGRNALFAAARRNRAFEFTALVYTHQGTENTGWLSDDLLRATAGSIPGLDAADLVAARASPSDAAQIEQQRAGDGVTGVPTFFVRPSGESGRGTMLVNPSDVELEAVLRSS